MSIDALAQAFTRMLGDEEFVAQIKDDPTGTLAEYDLTAIESGMLADAAREGVELMTEDESTAMKRIAAEIQGAHGQISPETQEALTKAVQERMRAQLSKLNIDPNDLR